MAKQIINVSTPNSGKGDPLRLAFSKINDNFTELYVALGINDGTSLNLGAFEFNGSTISTTDSSSIIVEQSIRLKSTLVVDGELMAIIDGGNAATTY